MRRLVAVNMIATLGAPAVAQTQLWVDQFGTIHPDGANNLAPDTAGGVFVLGSTGGSLAAPNPSTGPDMWLARYGGTGSRHWLLQFGGPGVNNEEGRALAPDGAGGVFLAGLTSVGLVVPSPCQAWDTWIARYDATGVRAWILQFATCFEDHANALIPDGAGGFFIGGGASGNLGGPYFGGPGDAWLARYDGAGTRTWITQFGTSQFDVCWSLAPDGAGGFFATGVTGGSLGGPSAGGHDVWLARYTGAGLRVWIRQFGTSGPDGGYAGGLAPDGQGGVYMASHMGAAYVLARHDGEGNQLWVRQPLPSACCEISLASDGAGGVYAVQEGRLVRYDENGNLTWMVQVLPGSGWAVLADGQGGVFATGYVPNIPGPLGYHADAWVARYTEACYPDCNADGQLTVADFGCFQTKFVAADPYADCNGDGSRTVADFGCFQTKFVAGCP